MFENESKKNEGYILKGLNSPPQIGKLGHNGVRTYLQTENLCIQQSREQVLIF